MSSSELYVGNIEINTKSDDLKQLFQMYGSIIRTEVIIGSINHNVAYGFVEFESKKDAECAQRQLHRYMFRGHRIHVQFAKSKKRKLPWRPRIKGFSDYTTVKSNKPDRSRNFNRDDLSDRNHQRQSRRSPSYGERSRRDRDTNDDRRRKRDRSRSSSNDKSSSKRLHTSSNDNQSRSSNSNSNSNNNNHK